MSDWSHPSEQPQYVLPSQFARTLDHRPGSVTAAVILTWVSCALAAVGCALLLMVSTSDAALDGFQQGSNGAFTREEARSLLSVAGVAGLVWCGIAAVLGALVLARLGWARVLLALSAGVTALASLALILSVFSAIPLVVSIVVLVLLFTGGANDWFAGRAHLATVSLPAVRRPDPPHS
jgi:hypothetical protein